MSNNAPNPARTPPHAPILPGKAEIARYFHAATIGNVKEVAQFIRDYPDLLENNGSSTGATAIILAAKAGKLEVVELLAGLGANLNAGDNGDQSAIFYAAANGEVAVARFLINHGVDPTAPNKAGVSAVAIAGAQDFPIFGQEMAAHRARHLQAEADAERRRLEAAREALLQNLRDVTETVKGGVKGKVAAPRTATFGNKCKTP